MAQRIRVLLLIPHLGGGGAEKVTALLACGLPPEKYDVHLGLVTAESVGTEILPEPVTVHRIDAGRVRYAAGRLLRLVWQVRPAVVLSNMAHLNFLVLALRALFPRGVRVVVRQNGTVSAMLDADRRPWLARLLYRVLYRRADRVICPSAAMANDLSAALGIEAGRIVVLPNPVDVEAIREAAQGPSLWAGPGPHLLAVGRLAPEKGFDLLIEALAQVRREFPQADLLIAGEGRERSALEAQARRFGSWAMSTGRTAFTRERRCLCSRRGTRACPTRCSRQRRAGCRLWRRRLRAAWSIFLEA